MTGCKFRMDVSFLVLLVKGLEERGVKVGVDGKETLDKIFKKIIHRNFRKIGAHNEYMVFTINDEDLGPSGANGWEKKRDHKYYKQNLQMTPDSFSDQEEKDGLSRNEKADNLPYRDNARFSNCFKLLLKCEYVITDDDGNVKKKQKLDKIS